MKSVAQILRRIVPAAFLLVGMAALSGCSLKMNELDKEILTDFSPEWDTTHVNREERVYRAAYTIDTNFRQLHEDVDRIMLLDRPTRLSRVPMP